MKRWILLAVCLALGAALGAALYAEPAERKYSLGIGLEANMNTPERYALGAGLSFMGLLPDFARLGRFSLGLMALYSYNFAELHCAEVELAFRWSFYDFLGRVKSGNGFYIEARGGLCAAWAEPGPEPVLFGLGQAAFGYRLGFANGLYVEPYLRAGYPVLWGAGCMLGYAW